MTFPAVSVGATGLKARIPCFGKDELRVAASASVWGNTVIAFRGVTRLDGTGDAIDPGQELSANRLTAVIDVRALAEVEVHVATVGGQSATAVRLEVVVE